MPRSPHDFLQLHNPAGVQRNLAERVRAIRVGLGLKQTTLALRAGVTLATLRRFEQTGLVSLKYLLRICHALGRLDDFENILRLPPATTMAQLEMVAAKRARKRGSR